MRPQRNQYYMGIALAVRERANCRRRKVGAVLVLEDRVVATGYNGTPQGMKNCDEGGCERCSQSERFKPGEGYDLCICVHAEQNCLLSAARFGISVADSDLYTTMRPCFGCLKELLQAGISCIYYLDDWQTPPPDFTDQYRKLEERFAGGVQQVADQDSAGQEIAP
jgi:dCMP deaminase